MSNMTQNNQLYSDALQAFQRQAFSDCAITLEKILATDPQATQALELLGVCSQQMGNSDKALTCLSKAAKLAPDNPQVLNNYGEICRLSNDYPLAITLFKKAIALSPHQAQYHLNLANTYKLNKLLSDANVHYVKALEIEPGSSQYHISLGLFFEHVRQYEQALAIFTNAAKKFPHDTKVQTGFGMLSIQHGNFLPGFNAYEWRFHFPENYHAHPKNKYWKNEPLNGKTILCHAEQGFGDTLQFVRYCAGLKAMGANVVLEVQDALVPLLETIPSVHQVVTRGNRYTQYDYHAPLMSLPRLFKTTLEDLPVKTGYIPRPASRNVLKTYKSVLKVGLVWAGDPKHSNDHNRSMPFHYFHPLTGLDNVQLFSLQLGDAAKQCEDYVADKRVIDLTPHMNSFLDSAALFGELDLIITIDSAPAHLAGALGCPVWLMLPYIGEWRWLIERKDSPWYPSMQVFRQQAPGDWASVINQLKEALCATNLRII